MDRLFPDRNGAEPSEADRSVTVIAVRFRKTSTSCTSQEMVVFFCHLIGQSTLCLFCCWLRGRASKPCPATISKQGLG